MLNPTLLAAVTTSVIVPSFFACCFLGAKIDDATHHTVTGLGIPTTIFITIVATTGVGVYHAMMQYNINIPDLAFGFVIVGVLIYLSIAAGYILREALSEARALTTQRT